MLFTRQSGHILAFLVLILLPLSTPVAAQYYTITDLGVLSGGTNSEAFGLNNSGQIVGQSDTASSSNGHAFLYSNGIMTDLGTLGGNFSVANSINDNGQISGGAADTNGNEYAFVWSNGNLQNLGVLSGGTGSAAFSINQSGKAVGYSYANGIDHAALFDSGNVQDLGTLGGTSSIGIGINKFGQIVGDSDTSYFNNHSHAFLYSNGTMRDLGLLPGGTTSSAKAINDLGQIIGSANTSDYTDHAFFSATV